MKATHKVPCQVLPNQNRQHFIVWPERQRDRATERRMARLPDKHRDSPTVREIAACGRGSKCVTNKYLKT